MDETENHAFLALRQHLGEGRFPRIAIQENDRFYRSERKKNGRTVAFSSECRKARLCGQQEKLVLHVRRNPRTPVRMESSR